VERLNLNIPSATRQKLKQMGVLTDADIRKVIETN
jgi:hypothetical protein